MKHLNITVKGKVQGVYYRASTKKAADHLGIKGFVRNQPNGDVYIEAEAEEETINEFVTWCWSGPTMARVTDIELSEQPIAGYEGFVVKY
ncbi:MAG: acylphosphatase [Bacteroidota bacterium]